MLMHPRLTAFNRLPLVAPPLGARPPHLHPLCRCLCAPQRVGHPAPFRGSALAAPLGAWPLATSRLTPGLWHTSAGPPLLW
jgi:hypothetical protein